MPRDPGSSSRRSRKGCGSRPRNAIQGSWTARPERPRRSRWFHLFHDGQSRGSSDAYRTGRITVKPSRKKVGRRENLLNIEFTNLAPFAEIYALSVLDAPD